MWELNPGLSALNFQGMLTTRLLDQRYSENDLTTSPGRSRLPRCKSVAFAGLFPALWFSSTTLNTGRIRWTLHCEPTTGLNVTLQWTGRGNCPDCRPTLRISSWGRGSRPLLKTKIMFTSSDFWGFWEGTRNKLQDQELNQQTSALLAVNAAPPPPQFIIWKCTPRSRATARLHHFSVTPVS